METIHLPTSRSGFGKQMKFYGTEKHKYNKNNRNLYRNNKKEFVLKGAQKEDTRTGPKEPNDQVDL